MKCYTILFFILSLFTANQALSSQSGANEATNEFKAVTMKWAELLDDGALPGMSPNDHGHANVYQLNEAVQKLLVDRKTINTNMLNDVKNYRKDDCFVVGVVTTDKRNLAYFFYVENGGVELVSAYQFETNGWVRIRKH